VTQTRRQTVRRSQVDRRHAVDQLPAGQFADLMPTGLTVLHDGPLAMGPVPVAPDTFPAYATMPTFGVVNPGGHLTELTTDPTYPNVLRATFDTGFVYGGSPGKFYTSHPSATECFTGVLWRPSTNHETGAANQKIVYALWAQGVPAPTLLACEMIGAAPPYEVGVIPVGIAGWDTILHAGTGVGAQKSAVTLGAWNRTAFYIKYASTPTATDGIIRWWHALDGGPWVLQGNVTTFVHPAAGGNSFELYLGRAGAPAGAVKTGPADTLDVAHLIVAVR
jgi:hypothetical protein